MPQIASVKLLIAGVIAFALGWMFRSWASRNSLTSLGMDAAKSAAWDSVRNRQMPSVPGEYQQKFEELKHASNTDRAKKVAGYGVRHVLASFVGMAGWVLLLAGLVMAALGIWWK